MSEMRCDSLRCDSTRFDVMRNVRRQADNFQFPQMMLERTAVALDADGLAFGHNRNFHVNLFGQINAMEIDVNNVLVDRMQLNIANDRRIIA